MTEQEAVAQLKNGNIGGLELLVRQHQTEALRAVYLIVHDRAAAEDIVQAAFIRVYERISQFDQPTFPICLSLQISVYYAPWFQA